LSKLPEPFSPANQPIARQPVQNRWNPKPAQPPILEPTQFQKEIEQVIQGLDVVMGIDPGFASLGVSVIGRPTQGKIQLLHMGMVATQKAKKKERVNLRVTNDDQRRYDEIYDALELLRQRFRPTAVGVEAYHPHVKAASGWKTAVVYGGIMFWSKAVNIYCAPYVPQDLKRRFCGNQSGSKPEVASAATQLVEGASAAYLATNKTDQEHVGDSLGHAILVLEEIDRVRKIVRGMP